MRLIITIPAYNEEKTVASVIRGVPRQLEGIDEVKILVIDDGSTDNTVAVSQEAGADYVITHQNVGLATNFKISQDEALQRGADIILNIDADNQYDPDEIPKLIQPILDNKAEIVSGNRQVKNLDHMPSSKKYGNMIGTWVVKKVSGLPIQDASSGFRAYSREAALRLNVISQHTYTHETIIQAANKHLRFIEVPCTFRETERANQESRLIGGVWGHIKKSGATIVRTYSTYRSLKTFFYIGLPFILVGTFFILRFFYYYFFNSGAGHIQSLIIAAILIIVGFQVFVIGLMADGISANRKINEEILYRLNKEKYNGNSQ